MNLINEIAQNNKVLTSEEIYAGIINNSNCFLYAFAKTIGDVFGNYPEGEGEGFDKEREEYTLKAEEYIKSDDGVMAFKANQIKCLGQMTIVALEGLTSILKDEDKIYDLFHVLLSSQETLQTKISDEAILKMLKKLTYIAPSLEL